MKEEIWKDIEGFPLYRVSSFGRVMSLSRSHTRINRYDGRINVIRWRERIIRGYTAKQPNGNPSVVVVSLRKNGETTQVRLSHLVLNAFVGPRAEGLEACHNDGNPENNSVENLRWDTRQANAIDAIRHGTQKNPPVLYGEKNSKTKLTDDQVLEIRSLPYWYGLNIELSRKYGVSQSQIGRIRKGKQRCHGAQT